MKIEEAIQEIEQVIHTEIKWPGTERTVEALEMAINARRTKEEGKDCLRTTWETPESCPYCGEHLSMDWSFCPKCGRPTDWSENEPLTVEELREMVGQPIWIEFIHKRTSSKYQIVRGLSYNAVLFEEYDKDFGPYNSVYLGHYGKTWLPYRNRLAGGNK